MEKKLKTSVTLTKTAQDLLKLIAEDLGLNQSAALEVIIREKGKTLKNDISTTPN